jgi:hypothetical protein
LNRGLRRQGYVCTECQYSVHPKCKKLAILSETCKVVQEKSSSFISSSSSISIPGRVSPIPLQSTSPPSQKFSSSQPPPSLQSTSPPSLSSSTLARANGHTSPGSNSAQITPSTSFELLSNATVSTNGQSLSDYITNSEVSECEELSAEPVLEEFQHQCMLLFLPFLQHALSSSH